MPSSASSGTLYVRPYIPRYVRSTHASSPYSYAAIKPREAYNSEKVGRVMSAVTPAFPPTGGTQSMWGGN